MTTPPKAAGVTWKKFDAHIGKVPGVT